MPHSLRQYAYTALYSHVLLRDGWILDEDLIPPRWAGGALCSLQHLLQWAAYVTARDWLS